MHRPARAAWTVAQPGETGAYGSPGAALQVRGCACAAAASQGRASRHWSAAVRLPQVFDERLCDIACVGNGRVERGSCGVDGHRVHQGHPRLRIVHARPLPARPCAAPADPPEPPCSPEGLRIAVDAPRRSAPPREAPRAALGLIRASDLRCGRPPVFADRLSGRPSSSSRSKSVLAGVDIRCLRGYDFFRSRDRARPGRHELPGSSPRMTVRWWSFEARLLYDGDGTDDRTGWPEVTRGRREQDRS